MLVPRCAHLLRLCAISSCAFKAMCCHAGLVMAGRFRGSRWGDGEMLAGTRGASHPRGVARSILCPGPAPAPTHPLKAVFPRFLLPPTAQGFGIWAVRRLEPGLRLYLSKLQMQKPSVPAELLRNSNLQIHWDLWDVIYPQVILCSIVKAKD